MRISLKSAVAVCGVLALATGALASDGAAEQDARGGSDLGTGWNILQIPAAAFVPLGGGSIVHGSHGYVTPTSGTAWAAVSLPSGAAIAFLDLYAVDSDSDDLSVTLRRYTGYGIRGNGGLCPFPCLAVLPGTSDVVSVSTSGSPGFVYVSSNMLDPPHTVNNNVVFGGGAQYAVVVNVPPGGGPVMFKGVDIWWKRQISPAPVNASFTDVPTDAQFFAEVEAMKAAGITAGCTASTYCPESFVTRRQMAAFFARALGLYWQY